MIEYDEDNRLNNYNSLSAPSFKHLSEYANFSKILAFLISVNSG